MCVRTDKAQRPPVAGVCFWPDGGKGKRWEGWQGGQGGLGLGRCVSSTGATTSPLRPTSTGVQIICETIPETTGVIFISLSYSTDPRSTARKPNSSWRFRQSVRSGGEQDDSDLNRLADYIRLMVKRWTCLCAEKTETHTGWGNSTVIIMLHTFYWKIIVGYRYLGIQTERRTSFV